MSKHNELPLTEYSTRGMLYNPTTKTLSAEASDIQFKGAERIFNDAADAGIALRSHRTGKVVKFVLVNTKQDSDGDILFWDFKPLTPMMGVDLVTIFND